MAKATISDLEKFWQFVERRENGCLEWKRLLDRDGYGLFHIGSRRDKTKKIVRAHRWSYENFVGPIPAGLQIDHLCRNRKCVEPAHLDPVTALINTQRGWRANKTICKSGHPLSGDNLYVSPSGVRACKECRRRWVRENYKKTGGAAQKKYSSLNRKLLAKKQAARRAMWSEEKRQQQREYEAIRWLNRRKRRQGLGMI